MTVGLVPNSALYVVAFQEESTFLRVNAARMSWQHFIQLSPPVTNDTCIVFFLPNQLWSFKKKEEAHCRLRGRHGSTAGLNVFHHNPSPALGESWGGNNLIDNWARWLQGVCAFFLLGMLEIIIKAVRAAWSLDCGPGLLRRRLRRSTPRA